MIIWSAHSTCYITGTCLYQSVYAALFAVTKLGGPGHLWWPWS